MWLVTAVRIDVTQVWATTTARRHVRNVVRTKGFSHPAFHVASLTLQFNVQRLAAGTDLVKTKRTFAFGRTSMNKLQPRKVIEVPFLTGHHETSRDDKRGSPLCRAVVNVTRSVRAIGRSFRLKEARTLRCQQPAPRADHPPGKRSNR